MPAGTIRTEDTPMPSEVRTFFEKIDVALIIVTDLGFTLVERGRLFGMKGSVGDNPDYLTRGLKVVSTENSVVRERCDLIIKIKAALDASSPNDVRRQKIKLEAHREALEGKSVKALMISGDLDQLQQAARFLEKATA
jgi:hypothetical protein